MAGDRGRGGTLAASAPSAGGRTGAPAAGGRRILLVRHGRLGESLAWTAVPRAILGANPGDAVSVLTNRPEVWRDHPFVEEVHALPEELRGSRAAGRLEAVAGLLRARAFDAVVVSRESGILAEVVRSLRVPLLLDRPALSVLPERGPGSGAAARPGRPRTHRSGAAVSFAAPLGVAPPPWPMCFRVPVPVRGRARELLRGLGVPEGARIVALNLGTHQTLRFLPLRRDRTWPVRNFVRCARLLLAAPGNGDLRFFLNQCSLDDRLRAGRVALALPGGRAVSLRRREDLRIVGGILLECACLVTSDTGLLHLGIALGVPTVGIFGPRVPPSAVWPHGGGGRCAMIGPPDGADGGIASITGEEVARAVTRLLEAPAPEGIA